jgi:hypothetical protein
MFDEMKTQHTPERKPVRAKIPTELHDRLVYQAQYELMTIDEFIERLLRQQLSATPAV